jgi:hypothetical protein
MAIKYLHSKKVTHSLKKLLHQKIAGFQPGRPLTTIHSSAVTYQEKKFCAREHSIYSVVNVTMPDEFVGTAMSITFDIGRFIQSQINNNWLVEYMVGDWVCSCCRMRYKDCKKPKVLCAKCGQNKWIYDEINIISDVSGISGGLDVLLDFGTGKFTIAEIKSLDKDQFKELKAPKAEHRERTNLYMQLVKESSQEIAKYIDSSQAIILYVSKSFGFLDPDIKGYEFADAPFSPFKEFKILSEPAKVQHLTKLGKSVKDFREGKTPIPAKICTGITDKRAAKCCCKAACFSGKYPDHKYMRDV